MKPLAPPVIPRTLCVSITLSEHCEQAQATAFRARLQRYLRGSGLGLAFRGNALYLGFGDAPIGPLERALLVAWIACQPEVALVRVERHSRHGARDGQV